MIYNYILYRFKASHVTHMPLPPPFHVCPALKSAVEALSVEALSHRVVVENPFSKFTLLQDYPQALEHYDDYEEYTFGELRAENTIIEKFGQSVKVSKMSFVFFTYDPFLVIYLTSLFILKHIQ